MIIRNLFNEIEQSGQFVDTMKKLIPNQNFHILTDPKKDNFVFNPPIVLDYIVETQVIQFSFLRSLVNEYFKNKDVDVSKHILVLSPHETFNQRQKIRNKDYHLPLFVFKLQEIPLLDSYNNNFLINWKNNYFSQNTRQQTKDFIIKQYKQIKEQNDPTYSREVISDKLIPTLYFDLQVQTCEQTLNIYQETVRELNKFFIMMNTEFFVNTVRKYQYILPIDRLLKETNEQQKEIVERFQFPLFVNLDSYVSWDSYTNSTNYQIEQDNWELQRQQYNFTINTQVITRLNLQVSLLKMDLDFGIEYGEGEDTEWLKRIKIR